MNRAREYTGDGPRVNDHEISSTFRVVAGRAARGCRVAGWRAARNLFALDNLHVERLETAYRELEGAMRPHNCLNCHSPDNQARANPLELFSYPNQTLVSRHAIRDQIERGLMPPATGTATPGIADAAERARLAELARAFERAADDALAAAADERDAGDHRRRTVIRARPAPSIRPSASSIWIAAATGL